MPGLLHAAGDLKLLDQTRLSNGTAGEATIPRAVQPKARGARASRAAATCQGATVFVDHAEVTYELPAPAGHWLPNAHCTVFREAFENECPTGEGHYECQKARGERPARVRPCEASEAIEK